MILNDLVKEYTIAKAELLPAKKFAEQSKVVISLYINSFSDLSANYYNESYNYPKDGVVTDLKNSFSNLYSEICILNSCCRDLYKSLGTLSKFHFKNSILQEEINNLISYADTSVDFIYQILEMQLEKAKKKRAFLDLISSLNHFTAAYSNLLSTATHFDYCSNLLYEPLPKSIEDSEDYSNFTINSLAQSDNLSVVADSISYFGKMLDNVMRLLELPTSERYYIRKIETGSLVITITSSTISLVAILKFIDFCFKKYIEYRKANLEIQSMRQQIISTDLELLEKTLDLNPNLENKSELIEKASANAFNYFKFNPKFRIGDKTYDTGETTPLITDVAPNTLSDSV